MRIITIKQEIYTCNIAQSNSKNLEFIQWLVWFTSIRVDKMIAEVSTFEFCLVITSLMCQKVFLHNWKESKSLILYVTSSFSLISTLSGPTRSLGRYQSRCGTWTPLLGKYFTCLYEATILKLRLGYISNISQAYDTWMPSIYLSVLYLALYCLDMDYTILMSK